MKDYTQDKKELVDAMKKLGITTVVNNGRTVGDISKEVSFSKTKTNKLLRQLGEEGVVNYIRGYCYWIFQK